MSVVDALRSSSPDWVSRRPWLVLLLSAALLLAIGIGIGSGMANTHLIDQIAGDYHWQMRHQLQDDAPVAHPRPKECPTA